MKTDTIVVCMIAVPLLVTALFLLLSLGLDAAHSLIGCIRARKGKYSPRISFAWLMLPTAILLGVFHVHNSIAWPIIAIAAPSCVFADWLIKRRRKKEFWDQVEEFRQHSSITPELRERIRNGEFRSHKGK